MCDMQLIHVRVPSDIVKALDDIDRSRSRAEKVSEALVDYLRKRRLLDAVEAGTSSLLPQEHQIWKSELAVDTWMRERRAECDRDSS